MRGRGIGRRGPGLVGTMARTAVVAGTATRVSGNVARRQEAQHAQQAPPVQYVEAPAPPPPPAAPPVDMIGQLKELAELKDQGILTQAEFDVQKAKLLSA